MNEVTSPDKNTLTTGKYFIEFSKGPSEVYKADEEGNKIWICTTTDPEAAMEIVEGLILVEQKRFYYPDSTPAITTKVEPVPEEDQS